MWSWRDSNPRPNKQYISFLHAYSVFDFRLQTEHRHPIYSLSSKIFDLVAKQNETYFRIAMPQVQTPQNRAFVRHLASLLYFGRAQNPTIIQIMLQEQTLGRQLKLCSKGLKRSRHGSLHAYLPIGLAVETSQPQLISLQRYNISANIFWACFLCRSAAAEKTGLRQVAFFWRPRRAPKKELQQLPPPSRGTRSRSAFYAENQGVT